MEPRFSHPYPHQQAPPPSIHTPEASRFSAIPPPPYSVQSPLATRDPTRREDPFYPRRPPYESHAHSPLRAEPPPAYNPPPHYPPNTYPHNSGSNGHGPARNGYAHDVHYEQKRRELADTRREAGTFGTFSLGSSMSWVKRALPRHATTWKQPETIGGLLHLKSSCSECLSTRSAWLAGCWHATRPTSF